MGKNLNFRRQQKSAEKERTQLFLLVFQIYEYGL